MIDLPIVDTHLHLWDPQLLSYPWLAGEPAISSPHLLADYAKATAGLPIERMVFVQCEAEFSQFQAEADWVESQAQQDPRIQGIVTWAPLELGEAARPALAKLAANPRVKGIRRIIQFETDTEFCLNPDFIRGVQLLPEYGLSFDLCIKGDIQFANTLTLVRQCPGVQFILDHIGKPFIKEAIREPWATHIRALATLPNTFCKVSGLANEAAWNAWTPADLQPYLDTVFTAFGHDRVCFGGDWPVCTLATTYRTWAETLWTYAAAWNHQQRRKLFHDNAITFYRLEH